MKMRRPGNGLTYYLLATCTLLIIVLALEGRNMARSYKEASSTATPAPAASAPTEKALAAPRLAAFNEITERPLFTPDRKPPPEPTAQQRPPAPPPQPLRLRLEGIAITPQASIAVVRDLTNNEILRLGVGMQHQGWELSDIGTSGVTFRLGEQDQEITLYVDKPTGPSTRRPHRTGR